MLSLELLENVVDFALKELNPGGNMVSKYFRKAGVPQTDIDGNVLKDENGDSIIFDKTVKTIITLVFKSLAKTDDDLNR